MVTNEEKLPKLELRESRSTTCFVPLETDSLTEELMQDEVRRGNSDFGTTCFNRQGFSCCCLR